MDKHSVTISKNGEVKSITFNPKKFTPEQAKQWLADNGYEIVDFTEAGPEPTEAGFGSGGKRDGDRGPDQTAPKRTWKTARK